MSPSHIDVAVLAREACPVSEVIDHVSGKWSLGILVTAAQGPVRFAELHRGIPGVSRRILSLKLRQLERDGLLLRTVYPTVPPSVEYRITDIAVELVELLGSLKGWAVRHRDAVGAARSRSAQWLITVRGWAYGSSSAGTGNSMYSPNGERPPARAEANSLTACSPSATCGQPGST